MNQPPPFNVDWKGKPQTWKKRRGKSKESRWQIIVCCLLDQCQTAIMALSCRLQPDELSAMWPCCLLKSNPCPYSSCPHRFPEQGGLRAAPKQLSSGCSRAGTPSCGDNPLWMATMLQCLSIPKWNTISIGYILCFHFQVDFSFAFSWVGPYDNPQRLILICVYYQFDTLTNIYFSNHSVKCFTDTIKMDINLTFGLIRTDIHQVS